MDLDEMKTLWKETDRRLAAMEGPLRASLERARGGVFDRTRSRLRWVQAVWCYEVAFGLLAALLAGSYLYDHLGTARFAVPAAALHLGAILTLGVAVWQLVALRQVDYALPVVDIQRRLAELGLVRARANRWLLLSAPLAWALLVVVVPHGLIGLDVYAAFGLPWVAGNFGFGLAVLAAAAWVSAHAPAGSRVASLLRGLGDDLAGRRVAAAAGLLDDVAAFARE